MSERQPFVAIPENSRVASEAKNVEQQDERRIDDATIRSTADTIVHNLNTLMPPMGVDEYVDLLRPYFSTGGHPAYEGYSGEDLRALARSVASLSRASRTSSRFSF